MSHPLLMGEASVITSSLCAELLVEVEKIVASDISVHPALAMDGFERNQQLVHQYAHGRLGYGSILGVD